MTAARPLLVLALATATACGNRDIHLLPRLGADGSNADGSNADASNADAGGLVDLAGPETAAAPSCTGLGVPIQLRTGAGTACAGGLAARSHAFVLCSCGLLAVSSRVRTDSLTSGGGGSSEGAIGVNGALQTTAEVRAGGAIVVGAAGIRADAHVQTGRSLRTGGPFALLSSNADIAGDAFVGGDVSGSVRIDGALHVPAAAMVGADVEAQTIVREAVTIAPPCPCDPAFVDLAGVVTAAVGSGNAIPSIVVPAGGVSSVSIPCGTHHVPSIDAQGPLILEVHGRALLAVEGDVALRSGMQVALDPGAELDLVVRGRLVTSGSVPIGALLHSAAFRIWIAGAQTVIFDGSPLVGATIYAPAATVSAANGLELNGSLLAGSITFGGELMLHFDDAILAAGSSCGEPAVPAPQ